ncbi:MAG: flagellar motor stator protein MotA [Deltaproteobacteria bacterium]|nr:flagellar motor stator protein MotA [Deltaproteobacteria bacterium]MDZ4346544.1 flagellar motor stator protein MotA [Candidatus Binatia bacterium]
MLTLIGFVIVLGSVLGGFVLEGGPIAVLNQTVEFLIIGGAAIGSLVAGTPIKVLRALLASIKKAVFDAGYSKADYMEVFAMLYEVFSVMRKSGEMALEKDVDDPANSEIFKKYPKFLANHAAQGLMLDSLRLVISGSADADELANLMDEEIATHEEEARQPPGVLAKIGDALPGLGIVAAVLGVIIAMGSMDRGPEVIGHKIAAALVGTFLGILLCYGIVQPLVQKIELMLIEEAKYLECLKTGILAYLHGAAPIIAVEYARRVVFSTERPSALELENACRGKKE